MSLFNSSSSCLTSSISYLDRFFLEKFLRRNAPLPLLAISKLAVDLSYTEADTVLQRLSELRSHANKLILVLLDALLPVDHGFGDHVLDGCLVLAVQYITHPLFVEVVPVLLIRQMLEQSWLLPRML